MTIDIYETINNNIYNFPKKMPYITVSAKGISNGLSTIYNDGADFGPDTYLNATTKNRYGPPYTQTSGIQEAGNYANSIGGGIVFLDKGLFLIDTNINGSNWSGVSIIGSGSNITSSGVSNAFENGTTIAPSDKWNPTYTLTNFLLPNIGYFNYNPLIYVIGTGANSNNPTGANLEFKNFLLSGINKLNGSPFPNTMGLYMHGVWNLVVDHVDSQLIWWGKYFDLNGPSGNSNWFLNSTDIQSFDVGVYWNANLGAMVNIDVETVSNGHVQAYNNNFSGFAFIIEGVNATVSAQASNLSYTNASLVLGQYASVTNIMCNNNITTPAIILGGSYSSLSGFYIFSNGPNSPIFTTNQPNGSGNSPTNIIISSGTVVPSNNSAYPSTLFIGEINANSIVGNEILFSDISLGTGSSAYWTSPIISATGSLNPIKFKNVQGLSLYYTPALTANPPISGTVYQNLTFQDIIIYLPVYATTAGTNGSVAVALGTTSTPSTKFTKFVSGSTSNTATELITLEVPAGWYYSFTGTNVNFGTAIVEAI